MIPGFSVMGSDGDDWGKSDILRTFCGLAMTQEYLTYKQAAARVSSSVRTIRNWASWGMPMRWQVIDGQRTRVVELEVLLAFWRERMAASPVHFYRMRKRLAEDGIVLETPEHVKSMRAKATETRRGIRVPGTAERPGDGTTEPETPTPEPTVDPLAEMPRLRGSAEFFVLRERLRETVPACAGMPEYTADQHSAEDRERMAEICAGCDVLEQCQAFATASRPVAGFWPTGIAPAQRRS